MHKSTAWVKTNHSSSSLTSELLSKGGGKKGKAREQAQDQVPRTKSKELRRVERLIDSLEGGLPHVSAGREGCFCRARTHPLSPYAPMCMSCGLVLCLLQPPSLPCPSCQSPLLSPPARSALVTKLRAQIELILQKEAEAREAERLERIQRDIEARGGGSFPTLAAASRATPDIHTPSIPTGPRKVLSLNSKTKRVTVSSFTPAPPRSTGGGTSSSEAEDDEFSGIGLEPRVPAPPVETPFVTRKGTERRWEDLRGGGPLYVQPPQASRPSRRDAGVSGPGSGFGPAQGRKKRKPKEKAVDEGENASGGDAVSVGG